jgi:hypothetical protein
MGTFRIAAAQIAYLNCTNLLSKNTLSTPPFLGWVAGFDVNHLLSSFYENIASFEIAG